MRYICLALALLSACDSDEAAPTAVAGTWIGAPRPPGQPASGPGGSSYICAGVAKSQYGFGARAYYLYEPRLPAPSSAPVVVFLHGWGGTDPSVYEAWINHIVRKGRVVIYPVYQVLLVTRPEECLDFMVHALQNAFDELARWGHVHAQMARVAVVGHSFGGALSAALAVVAPAFSLPAPRAVMSVEPGGPTDIWPDWSGIPAGTLLLAIAGDRDDVVGTAFAQAVFAGATGVAPADKNYILVRSDTHGWPDLIANHFAPLAERPHIDGSLDYPPDALDWYGYWKWFDALSSTAWYGTDRAYGLGNTPEQRFMGLWSDGQPVVEPVVTVP